MIRFKDMTKSEQLLYQHSENLDKYLDRSRNEDRAFYSQGALLCLRHFVEHVMLFVYCEDNHTDLDDGWDNLTAACDYVYHNSDYQFLHEFHKNHLQKSVSHKIPDLDYSETLMILYYKPLVEIKYYLLNFRGINVLNNLSRYPLDMDETFSKYYRSIQGVVFKPHVLSKTTSGYYYIYKNKPIFIDNKLMYELTLGPANDFADKLDRFVAFSSINIFDNYAIEAFMVEEKVKYFDSYVSVIVVTDYNVSIRTYELNNIGKILNVHTKVRKKQEEFKFFMDYIKKNRIPLNRIIEYDDDSFDGLCKTIDTFDDKPILGLLKKAREIVIDNLPGSNTLRYLLCHIKNSTIFPQISIEPNPKLSNLRLLNGVLPFDETPFAANLIRSKQIVRHVFDCIDSDSSECQLLARRVKEQSDKTGQLYVKTDTIYSGDQLDYLVNSFNSLVPDFQKHREISRYHQNIYIKENEENTIDIINTLQRYTSKGLSGYTNQADNWLSQYGSIVKGDDKKEIIRTMFSKSKVFVLYGSAGTGKSTTVSYVLNILGNVKKVCLAATHPAVENMKRKIADQNAKYCTIKSFLSKDMVETDWDIVVIDECSIVSNDAMIKLLNKISFKVLLLTGDIFQLPSIDFGNWFHIAKSILPTYARAELVKQYRTNDDSLLTLWDKVRSFDNSIYEYLSNAHMTKVLDDSIFSNVEDDQIILCYNYDGLYGINSINRYLQEKNPNEAVVWSQYSFKVGDPIIFHNSNRFGDIIYNNLKGKITSIVKDNDKITFEIAIESSLSEINFTLSPADYVKSLDNGWTVIRFSVYKYDESEEKGAPEAIHVIPFQLAYAVSIYKSQGLEYDSVKVIIANNVEELITHNVFYTAITRAKKKLMVYWTPETASKVLTSFEPHFDEKDANIICSKFCLHKYNNQ